MVLGRYAPVALFAYKRTHHLARALDALETCAEFSATPVFVFSDGPKNSAVVEQVEAVRAMLKQRQRSNMTIVEAPSNLGLAASITAGVTRLCNEYGRAIVIEDDLIVSPYTLAWFNQGLDRFEGDESVWQVSAHQYRVSEFAKRSAGMLLPLVTSWGWATWKRSWARYDPNAPGWERLKTDPELAWRFDADGSYPYSKMLISQMEGRLDSWAIRYWWSVFCGGGLTLFPPRPLASNIGLDATATHSAVGGLKRFFVRPPSISNESRVPTIPADLKYSVGDAALVRKAIRRMWWATRARARILSALSTDRH